MNTLGFQMTDGVASDPINNPITMNQQTNFSLQTDISRGRAAVWELNQLIKRNFFSTEKYNVLLIGAGYHGRSGKKGIQVLCPYEIYNVAAYLEWKNLDYTISVVDIEGDILSDIQNRRNIFVPHELIKDNNEEYNPDMNWRREAWEGYLKATNQQDRITHKKIEGLETAPPDSLDTFLEEGVHYAEIPKRFSQKLDEKDIKLIQGDITNVELKEKYDFISCSNVLYMLSKENQKLSIRNMASALAKPGAIFLWEPLKAGQNKISPIIQSKGGWLNDKIRRNLDVTEIDLGYFDPKSQQVMLHRTL